MSNILDSLISVVNNSIDKDKKIKTCSICRGFFNYEFNPLQLLVEKKVKSEIIIYIYMEILSKISETIELTNTTNNKITICKTCYNSIIREIKEKAKK